MKTNKYLILITFYIIHSAFYIVAEATVRYVSKTGSSTPPYTSWSTAADSIQKCINICEDGDTIYVANGVYKEYLRINKEITLIGSSMDSTIIDGTGLSDTTIYVDNQRSFNMKNFTILGKNREDQTRALYLLNNLSGINTPFKIENCKIKNSRGGILAELINAKNIIFDIKTSAIGLNWVLQNQISSIENCVINNPEFQGIGIGKGLYIIRNNILINENPNNIAAGIDVALTKSFIIQNNLISGFKKNIYVDIVYDTSYIYNNISANRPPNWIGGSIDVSSVVKVINNIFKDNKSPALYGPTTTPNNYNIFWNNTSNFSRIIPGDSTFYVDPMFVNDTIPRYGGSWDYHLQAYSPAIDKGDPTILDRDGSRSDIGMYGGPFGEIYTYQDLAPRPPRNLTAVVDSGRVILRWKRNTEADTSHYNIYRSTTANFTIDSTKLIGSTKDTSFINTYLPIYERLYYKITCVDRQGNQSQPSEEIMINLTSISEYPTVVNDYYLYQNYPNPFNPTTKIGYKLKDRGYVKLMVYDIKGERIAVLVNQEQEAGYYEVEFGVGNGLPSVPDTGIASGIYIYRIEVIGEGNIPVYTEMRKMMLVK